MSQVVGDGRGVADGGDGSRPEMRTIRDGGPVQIGQSFRRGWVSPALPEEFGKKRVVAEPFPAVIERQDEQVSASRVLSMARLSGGR